MKRNASLFLLYICSVAAMVMAGVPTANAADDIDSTYAPKDTVFIDISLNDEGVTAIDTAGYDWYYNFDRDVFVAGERNGQEGFNTGERQQEGNYLPIEERATVEKKVKPFVNSVLVGVDEYVNGNIIAYGRVTIKGWVKGDVKSLNKRVLVSRSGRVDGNIEAPEIIVREGGTVLGKQTITSSGLDLPPITTTFSVDGVIVVLSFLVFFLFFGFVVTALMPKQLGRFRKVFEVYKLRTYFLGLFLLLAMPVVIALVIITIVGIVLVPFVPILYMFAIVMGVVSFSQRIGSTLTARLLGRDKSKLAQTVLGISFIMALWLAVAILLGTSGGVAEGFGIFFLVVAIIISTYPICSGLGAALLTRFGFREYMSWSDRRNLEGTPQAPAPPPIRERDLNRPSPHDSVPHVMPPPPMPPPRRDHDDFESKH
jgi:hypothetical protein